MATHSSILAWRILWTEEPGELQSMGCKESNVTETNNFTYTPNGLDFMSMGLLIFELYESPTWKVLSWNFGRRKKIRFFVAT